MKEILAGVPRETRSRGWSSSESWVCSTSTDAGADPFSKSGLGVGQKGWLEGTA